MSGIAEPRDVEALARELCESEGWDPNDWIDCEPSEAVAPRFDEAGRCVCARWEPYATAARKMIAARADEWDSF